MQLETNYLGLALRNPVVASAGPLSQTVDGVKALADGGVGAVVLYSLFEEQLRQEAARDEALIEQTEEFFAESLNFFPVPAQVEDNDVPPASRRYVELLERCANEVDVPVIASLNGSTTGGWVDFAKQMQDAGAAALELNIYLVPGDVATHGVDVEQRHVEILRGVKQAVSIPVAVKLSPFISSFGELAVQLDENGADGLVLFNRFIQPEIDVESVTVESGVELSSPIEGRVPRTWIASLRGRVNASLAGTTGVDTADDVARYLLAGADVVMTTSALVRRGPAYAAELVAGLESWMERKGFESVDDVRGILAVPTDARGESYARAGYVSALEKAKQVYGSLV